MKLTDRLADAVHSARVLGRSGALQPARPERLVRMAQAYRHWGYGLGAAFATSGARYADRVAIIDEQGAETFAQLDARTDAIARGLLREGVHSGHVVAVLCRNHRYIIEVTGAVAKIGADILYCNTAFSAAQLREVLGREGATMLVHDEEFTSIAKDAGTAHRVLAWYDHEPGDAQAQTLDKLAARYPDTRPPRPERNSNIIILTSGTTGTPRGAARDQSATAGPGLALLDAIPYRSGETMVLAAPIFHSWGFSNALAGLLLGDTLVLERRFDPEQTLGLIARHRANVLVAVPVMLLRIVDLPEDVQRRYDTSSLRLVPLSGSSLPGDLATRFMDAFGDVVYNLYGSTEVGYVTIASPDDLRAAPSTAGRPPRGVELRLLDEHDNDVRPGTTGRIFVHSALLFEGYTDGGSKTVVGGFMQSGDTGHLDENGRLFVDGRDDDMIVSGGENVFPAEVEDVIAGHPGVREAAVVGVPDDEFGQRLKAYVVRRDGATVDADAIKEHVRGALSRFKVPRDVDFVDELPRNPTGKLVKRELR